MTHLCGYMYFWCVDEEKTVCFIGEGTFRVGKEESGLSSF
jgi:hypothetical protein